MDNMDLKNEFKVLGLPIENFSLFYGFFLVAWGVIVSFISGSSSLTSYIPTFIGFTLIIFSYLAIKITSRKKLFMHIVVIIGLIIFLGGLDLVRSFSNGKAFENLWADISKLMMLLTGLYFLIQCVRSFIFARKNREQ